MRPERDYGAIARALDEASAEGPRALSHRVFVDLLWKHLASTDVSWLGIYLVEETSAPECRLRLGACRDRPACSPIGLHGVCGRAVVEARAVVVEDVRELGTAYVACDPHDLSEVVVPLRDGDGVWGVLDLDSRSIGAFDEVDAEALMELVARAGLTRSETGSGPTPMDSRSRRSGIGDAGRGLP